MKPLGEAESNRRGGIEYFGGPGAADGSGPYSKPGIHSRARNLCTELSGNRAPNLTLQKFTIHPGPLRLDEECGSQLRTGTPSR